ncbi:helix-turn-helix transcriptional regulator [Nocardia transvalensis]|nr:helix-turn-helix transcriptional regulator [Nocardia transvalensis]
MRGLRKACGINQETAAAVIGASPSKLSRLESGHTRFQRCDLTRLLAYYRVVDPAAQAEFLTLARRGNLPSSWREDSDWLPDNFEILLDLEQIAHGIRCYEQAVVPDLLQTPGYARAVLRLAHPNCTAEEIERRVDLRLRRQQLLTVPDAPRVWLLVEESALRRPYGGQAVWRAQLDRIAHLIHLPHITVQVVRDTAGGPAIVGYGFTHLRFAQPDLPDLVCLQTPTRALYVEDEADKDKHLMIADRLAGVADWPRETADLITAIREGRPLPERRGTAG